MSDTIFVSGAAGFIGFHLCRALLAAKESVVGFDNLNNYYDPRLKAARLDILKRSPRFSFVLGDLSDAAAVEKVFSENRPSMVYHLGAQAGVRYSLKNPNAFITSNIVGTFNVLEAIRKYPITQLLYASSSSVYGDDAQTPFSIRASTDRPVSLYAASKKTGELMAYTYSQLHGILSTGLRFFTVYGPFGRPDMAYFSFTEKILAGETIDVYNYGNLMRDFTYIDDIVDGLLALKDRVPDPDDKGVRHKLYNMGNSQPVRLDDFIATLENVLEKAAQKRYLPMQVADVHETYADITESARDFGFSPRTKIDEGLRRFADWYRAYYEEKEPAIKS